MNAYLCYKGRKRRILQSVELSVKAMSWGRNIFRERFCWPVSLPATNEVWSKVVFSQVFVCQLGGVGFTVCITGHMREGLPPGGSASRGVCLQGGLPPGGLPPGVCLQGGVCNHVGQTPYQRYMWYYEIQSTSGRYSSYWNVFLFVI